MAIFAIFQLSNSSLLKLTSFQFWSLLYLYVSIKCPHQPPEYGSRIVTLLHGTIASIIGVQQCGITTISASSFHSPTRAHHYLLMLWSWGYFAFDLLWCIASQTESSLMLCHHITSLIAITLYMRKSYTGCTFGCTMAMLECTNPLLQTRWLLRNEGHDKTWLFTIIEMIYLTMFMFLRGVIGSYVVLKVLRSDSFETDEKILSILFYVVSILFIHEIMGYVSYRYRDQFEKYKEKALTNWQKFIDDPRQFLHDLIFPPPEPEGFFYHYIIAPLIALYNYIMSFFVREEPPPGVIESITQQVDIAITKVSEVMAPIALSISNSYQNLVSVATSLQSSFASDCSANCSQ